MKNENITSVHDAFIVLEEEQNFWDLEAYGVKYWHQIRYNVFNSIVTGLGLLGPKHGSWRDRPLKDWLQPSRWFDAVRHSSWKNIGPTELLVFNHTRHVLSEHGWVCPYSFPLIDQSPYTSVVIEQGFQGLHYHPNATRNVRHLEWNKFWANMEFIALKSWQISNSKLGFQPILDGVKRQFDLQLHPNTIDKYANNAIRHHLAHSKMYEKLLDEVRPKAIVNVVHYSFRNMVMTPLAKARGIPVVELQHGFIGPSHLAYNFADGRKPEAFPDYFLLFGDMWRDMTPGLPLPKDRTPSIGFARIEQQIASAKKSTVKANDRKDILFISQGSVGEQLSKFAAEFSSIISSDEYRIVYKLHPSEMATWRQRYPWLADANVEVRDQLKDDIYQLFASSDIQVGVYSTALFEGLAFGLSTFIAKLPGHEDMSILIERNLAKLTEDAHELLSALAILKTSDKSKTEQTRDLSSIWQTDAVKRFGNFMDELLK